MMNSEQIVAKYTQPNENGNANGHGMKLRLIRAKNSKEILNKYTQNNHKISTTTAQNDRPPPSSAPFPFVHSPHLPLPSLFSVSVDKFARFSLHSSPSSSAVTPSFPLNKWTLWHFECGDFPVHINFREPCTFCLALCKFRVLFKNSFCEDKDRWDNYLQKGKTFADNGQPLLMDELTQFLPSKLAKDIFFNRKLGVAVFRDGITPKIESAENCAGGVFQLLLMASKGQRSASLLRKIDQLFLRSLQLIVDATPEVACHVTGLFIRWQIDSNGKRTPGGTDQPQEEGDQWNMDDLPIIAMMEVWINDQEYKKEVQKNLISDINKVLAKLKIPHNLFRSFSFHVRVRDDLYFENPFTAKKKMCSKQTFEALKLCDFQ